MSALQRHPRGARLGSGTSVHQRTIAGGQSPPLRNAFTFGVLAGEEEGFDEFALAADRHAGEAFVPLTFGDFGFSIEPTRKHDKLISTDLARLDAVEEMLEQCRRDILATDLGHETFCCGGGALGRRRRNPSPVPIRSGHPLPKGESKGQIP